MTSPEPIPDASRGQTFWSGVGQAVHDRIAPAVDARKRDHLAGILETFESDLVPHLRPLLAGIVDNPDVPAPIRDLVAAITEPQHFTQSLLIGIALGAVISPVLATATAPFIQVLANETWQVNPSVPLTPDLLAAAVIKGVMSEADAGAVAATSGTDRNNFHTMTMTAGQSLGAGDALLLLRRGQITEAEFERIIRYSNVRNDFIPDVLKLMFAPPPTGEVIAGALKQHLPAAEAKQKLAEAGIDPVNFDWMLATAGRPYGTQQALELLNRGKITEDRVRQVIAQSDINPAFTDDILQLRVYLPPPRSIVPMLRSGAITEARARELFIDHGLQPQDADAFIREATHTKTGAAKDLTTAQVLGMYSDQFVDRPTATTRLVSVGYPADEITLLLDHADHVRDEKLIRGLVARVRALYVAHHLTRAEAAQAMNAAPVPDAAQTTLFHVWDLERAANVHHPTVTQVVAAYRRRDITDVQLHARLVALGVQAADMAIVTGPAQHHVTPSQIVGAFRRTEIAADETRYRLLAAGVGPDDLAIVVADGWPPGKAGDAKAAASAVLHAGPWTPP